LVIVDQFWTWIMALLDDDCFLKDQTKDYFNLKTWWQKSKKSNNLLPTLKKHSQCEGCGTDFKKYYLHFKISNAHKCFTTCKLGVYMYMTYKIKL
jgi:hypothetical protein